jgi:hypothetical protein
MTVTTPSCAFVPLHHTVRGQIMRSKTTQQYLFDFLKPDDKEGKTAVKREPANNSNAQESTSDDPVDKIFSFFFGAKEENPMGMKRFGRGAQTWRLR